MSKETKGTEGFRKEILELEGTSKDGKATIWLSGNQEPRRVKIDPSLLREGQEATEIAKNIGITLFSTPFDEKAADLLESLETPAYKIASFELTDLRPTGDQIAHAPIHSYVLSASKIRQPPSPPKRYHISLYSSTQMVR